MTTFNRREILTAFLGLPVALAACRRSPAPPLPAGEIVGASDVFGHRLRDGQSVEVPADAWEQRARGDRRWRCRRFNRSLALAQIRLSKTSR